MLLDWNAATIDAKRWPERYNSDIHPQLVEQQVPKMLGVMTGSRINFDRDDMRLLKHAGESLLNLGLQNSQTSTSR
jgi:hypothetical protein